MKKNNKKNFLIILVMILTSLVLQGCGNGGIGEDAENQMIRTYNKVATDLKITPDYAPRPYLIAMTDSLCYFGQETITEQNEELFYHCEFYCKSLDASDAPTLVVEIDGPQVLAFDVLSDEAGNDVLSILTKEENKCVLSEYNPKGEEINRFELTDEDFVEAHMTDMVKCRDDSYIAYNANFLAVFDEEGNVLNIMKCPGAGYQDAVILKNGDVYVTYQESNSTKCYLSKVNRNTATLSETIDIPENVQLVCEDQDGSLLIMDNESLYRFNMSTKKAEEILKIAEYNISQYRIRAWDILNDSIRMITWDSTSMGKPVQLVTLTQKSEEELTKEREEAAAYPSDAEKYDVDGKQIITFYDPSGLGSMLIGTHIIDEFNEENEKYTLVMHSDSPNVETILAAQESPDLMFVYDSTDVEVYQRGGYLQDLRPYVEASEILSFDDLQESIVAGFTYDGGLYALPSKCTLVTLRCLQTQIGDKQGWTVDEFLKWLEENPDTRGSFGLSERSILEYCLRGNLESYVDFEKRYADLTSEEFKNTLFRISQLKLDSNYYTELTESDKEKNYLLDSYVSGSFDIVRDEQFYGESIVNMGYPCDNGSSKIILESMANMCILSNSDCKEGAFAFIEYCLMYPQYQMLEVESGLLANGAFFGSLWTVKSLMEKEFELYKENVIWNESDSGEVSATVYELTEEHKDIILSMFANAEPDIYEKRIIREIVLEEAQPYFLGQKDLDTVCEIMQSRVNVLLSERE